MALDVEKMVREKMEAAAKDKKNKDEKADAAIWAAVLVNAGMGAVPFGINVWTFVGVSTAMVVYLGKLYGKFLSHEEAGKLVKHVLLSVGWMWGTTTLGLKFFAEVLKGAGVITMGGTTVAGMALDAGLSGGVTYALGFTTKSYFKQGGELSEEEIRREFKAKFKEGKEKIKNR